MSSQASLDLTVYSSVLTNLLIFVFAGISEDPQHQLNEFVLLKYKPGADATFGATWWAAKRIGITVPADHDAMVEEFFHYRA